MKFLTIIYQFLTIIYNNKRQLASVAFVVLLLGAFFSLLKSCVFYDPEGSIEIQSKNEYSCISTEYLGQFIYEKYPDAKVLVVYDAISSSPLIEQRLTGLRKSFDGKIDVVAEIGFPLKTPKERPARMMHSIDYIKADDFNEIMQKYPNVNMIISLVGLPYDVQNMHIWDITDSKKRPRVIVFGGSLKYLTPVIKAGVIDALVIYREMDQSVNQLPPDDLKEAFDRRFRLITPENIQKKDKK